MIVLSPGLAPRQKIVEGPCQGQLPASWHQDQEEREHTLQASLYICSIQASTAWVRGSLLGKVPLLN